MLITLTEAQKLNPKITQSELDGLEALVRGHTNNNFQKINVRFYDFEVKNGNKLVFNDDLAYLRTGDTIEITDTWALTGNGLLGSDGVNDGVYTVSSIDGNTLTLDTDRLYNGAYNSAFITKIAYPPDVISGVVKLIEYSAKTSDKIGIKSESIARMSVTYYDINANENIEGYPASLLSFLDKYRKLRYW